MIRRIPIPNSQTNLELQTACVQTFGLEKRKAPGEVRMKCLTTTPEKYVFRKELLGEGASGRVYVALDPETHALFCIKEIALKPHKNKVKNPSPTYHRERLSSLCREAHVTKVAERFCGPIRKLCNKKGTRAYLVQNLMSGRSLDCIDALCLTAPRSAVAISFSLEVAKDLQKLGQNGVLHFDINPGNICFNKEHKIIEFIDFGTSALGLEAMPGGSTEEYCTRNHEEGMLCTGRDDLFSLGATFAEFALGRRLFGYQTTGNSSTTVTQFKVHQTDFAARNHNTLSFEKKHHLQAYMNELTAISAPFASLCLYMLDIENFPNWTIDNTVHALYTMESDLSTADRKGVASAWNALPDFAVDVQRHVNLLRRDWCKVLAKDLVPVKQS